MKLLWAIIFSACFSSLTAQNFFDPQITTLLNPALKPFYFGVASGDPQQSQVIIWTKVWSDAEQTIPVKWEIATDTAMQNIVGRGEVKTTSASAYTVKVLVKDLQPGTTYFYRFQTRTVYSPIGRTKTAPVQTRHLRFAVVSCCNYEHGYFNAYRLIANRNDVDAVIHLGDYIYEYGNRPNKKHPNVRDHIPNHEILNLNDYRTRYAQYRLDPDLQEAHRLHPFITVWDDHEFANDSYKEGAKNHQSDEGNWEERKAIAKKAYFEWMPITDNAEESVVRKLNYGNLAELYMLDTRIEERCVQLINVFDTLRSCTTRTILGRKQTDWLIAGIDSSSARWKLIGNQVVFSELDAHSLGKSRAFNTDAWDGYPEERKEILDSFYRHDVKNVIILTGDIHLSWAFDLVQEPKNKKRYNAKTGQGVIGAEFVTPSVSSNGIGEKFPRGFANLVGLVLKRKTTNPHLRFQNLVDHGFVMLDLNEDRVNATWHLLNTVRKRDLKASSKDSWSTKYNANKLVKEK